MATFEDPASRINKIVDGAEPKFAKAFLGLVASIQNQATLERIAAFLARGDIEGALGNLLLASQALVVPWNATFNVAGTSTAAVIDSALASFGLPEINVVYDQLNEGALRVMRENQFRMVRGFTQGQVEATRTAILGGVRRGFNPRQQARAFRGSIGLTSSQVRAVQNYRDALESGSLDALNRQLRDRRFDSTVRRAAREGIPLTEAQVDRMTAAYQRRQLANRAETIARTEALRAASSGSQNMYLQAIQNGQLDPNQVQQQWNTAGGPRVRGSHASMDQQTQPIGSPFISGNGAQLFFPGDPNAPGSETIQCRCALGTRILSLGSVETTV